GVTIDDRVGPAEYNYRTREEYEARGESFFPAGEASEAPGRSCFLQDGGRVYHTYSTYARGLDGGAYYVLDLTPLGRQDDPGERVRGRPTSRASRWRRPSPSSPWRGCSCSASACGLSLGLDGDGDRGAVGDGLEDHAGGPRGGDELVDGVLVGLRAQGEGQAGGAEADRGVPVDAHRAPEVQVALRPHRAARQGGGPG